jgi:hypothetical protein
MGGALGEAASNFGAAFCQESPCSAGWAAFPSARQCLHVNGTGDQLQ